MNFSMESSLFQNDETDDCQQRGNIIATATDQSSNPESYNEELFEVQSCAHVSYIVGKQGFKIRKIRNETSTFIQTPVNGEEPVFVIRGANKNVNAAIAKLETLNQEFKLAIYLETKMFKDGDRIRNNLFLPARYIGLVVGKRGTIIKEIMQKSGADIVTPKVNTLNGFKITGRPDQISQAIEMIRKLIVQSNLVHVELVQLNEVEYELKMYHNNNYQ